MYGAAPHFRASSRSPIPPAAPSVCPCVLCHRELLSELRLKLVPTIKAGWTLWPAAHVINFALVPTQHRILYANVVSIAGTFILSRAAAKDSSRPRAEDGHSPMEAHRLREVLIDVVKVD